MLIGFDRHEYDPNTPKGHLKVYISDNEKQDYINLTKGQQIFII